MSFFGRLSSTHLKMSWVVLFGILYSIFVTAQTLSLKNYENFLGYQWRFSANSILWANSVHISDFLLNNNKSIIHGVDVSKFKMDSVQKFENSLSDSSLNSFNS